MALPIVIAVNQTGVDLPLSDLGLTILSNSSLNLSDINSFWEISASTDLELNIAAGGILINDGSNTLGLQESLNYINITGNVNGSSTASANQVAIFVDSNGNRIDGSVITVTPSGDIAIPGQVELSQMTSSAPAANSEGVLWVKTGTPNELFFTNNQGADLNLSSSAVPGLTASELELVNSLILNVSEDYHEEIIRTLNKVTSITIWKTQNKLVKIRDTIISRVLGKVSSIIISQYDEVGNLIIGQRLSQIINRNAAGKVISIDSTES